VQLGAKQEGVADIKRAFQALESKRREELRVRDKEIADLEKSLVCEKKKRELVEAQIDDIRGKNDAQVEEARAIAQRSEFQVDDAREEVRRAKSAFAALESKSAFKEQELVAQLEQCRSTLARVAEQYGRLASSAIPLSAHSRVKYERSLFQMRVFRLEGKLANAEGQVVELANLIRQTKEENTFLSARLKDAEEESKVYLRALDDARRTQHDTSALNFERAVQDDLTVIAKEIYDSEKVLREQHALESENACHIYRMICHELLPLCAILDKSIQDKDDLARQYVADLSAASAAKSSLASQLEALVAEREQHLKDMDVMKVTSETSDQRVREMETAMLADASKHDQILKKERDAVKRLTLTVQKSRMAEEGLRAEIEQ
jgi:hypothetical protein